MCAENAESDPWLSLLEPGAGATHVGDGEMEKGRVGLMDAALGIQGRDGVREPGLEVEKSPLIWWRCERSRDEVS